MKQLRKILVPTDFSIFAEYALDAAILFAKKLNAEIHLYHSADIPDDWEDLPAEVRYHDGANKQVAIKVRNILEQLQQKVEAEGITCYRHYTGGKFLKNINEIIEKIDFDLIVMGSHGASGKEEWFLGSNTQKVVRKLHQNVIVVKNKMTKIDFSEVLFVTGLEKEDQEAFRRFLDFIAYFNVDKVYVMTVNTSSFFSQPSILVKSVLKKFEAIAEGFNVSTHFYRDYTIDAGIRHFVDDYEIDLVGMSNHVRHPFKRIFQGSNVEMVVNHCEVPVLAIDYVEVKEEKKTEREREETI